MRSYLLLALVLLSGCQKKQEVEEPIRPVRFIEVESAADKGYRFFSGYSRANVETQLSFRVPGTIQDINVDVGTPVKKGDVIADLDPKDYILEVKEAEAALLEAEAVLRKGEANYDRIRNLYETESASRAELDSARTDYESGIANVNAARTKLELSEIRLGYTVLFAPLNGFIATKDVEVNENVNAGQKVVTLNSDDRVKVTIAMPESLIADVHVGQKVVVFFSAIPGAEYPALVTEVGVATTASTTYPVTVQLTTVTPEVRSGLSAEVLFDFFRGADSIFIPGYAILEDEGERFVFVLEPDPEEKGIFLAKKRAIEIVDVTDEGIEVSSGLKSGERIVTAGVQFLSDNQKVRLSKSP